MCNKWWPSPQTELMCRQSASDGFLEKWKAKALLGDDGTMFWRAGLPYDTQL